MKKKIPRPAKLNEAAGRVIFGCQMIFFLSNCFQIGQACSHLTYYCNYIVQISLQIILLCGAALTNHRTCSTMFLCFLIRFCLRYDLSAVQDILVEAQETFSFGYSG